MQTSRKDIRSGGRVYTAPLFGIIVLLLSYFLLTDWQQLPTVVGMLFNAMHWAH